MTEANDHPLLRNLLFGKRLTSSHEENELLISFPSVSILTERKELNEDFETISNSVAYKNPLQIRQDIISSDFPVNSCLPSIPGPIPEHLDNVALEVTDYNTKNFVDLGSTESTIMNLQLQLEKMKLHHEQKMNEVKLKYKKIIFELRRTIEKDKKIAVVNLKKLTELSVQKAVSDILVDLDRQKAAAEHYCSVIKTQESKINYLSKELGLLKVNMVHCNVNDSTDDQDCTYNCDTQKMKNEMSRCCSGYLVSCSKKSNSPHFQKDSEENDLTKDHNKDCVVLLQKSKEPVKWKEDINKVKDNAKKELEKLVSQFSLEDFDISNSVTHKSNINDLSTCIKARGVIDVSMAWKEEVPVNRIIVKKRSIGNSFQNRIDKETFKVAEDDVIIRENEKIRRADFSECLPNKRVRTMVDSETFISRECEFGKSLRYGNLNNNDMKSKTSEMSSHKCAAVLVAAKLMRPKCKICFSHCTILWRKNLFGEQVCFSCWKSGRKLRTYYIK